ncbi:hypothetical protein D3C77_146520 [compost metagenome]
MRIFLYKNRFFLGGGLIFASLVNCFIRYDGDWGRFFTIFTIQIWFAQGVYNFFSGGTIVVAPWGLDKNADPEWRAALACFALFIYLVVFFLDFKAY